MSVWKNTSNNSLIFPFNTIVGQIPNTSLLLQIITKSLLFLYDNIGTLTYFSGDGNQPIMMWSQLIVSPPAVFIVLKNFFKKVFHFMMLHSLKSAGWRMWIQFYTFQLFVQFWAI